MADHPLFRKKAPGIMQQLRDDFDLTVNQAAAILGNIGHECAGFEILQEIKPLVPGSKGGWGWAQWTGPRRREFEKWVKKQALDPSSDEANYGFLKWELENTETAAIPAVVAARSLNDAVRRFEQTFERASPKHKGYASRERYAAIAKEEYLKVIGNGDSSDTTIYVTSEEQVLEIGAEGPRVKALQEALAGLNYPVGATDGKFGALTRSAILSFQADNDLELTGEAGPDMWAALDRGRTRPLASARTGITAAELRRKRSTTILRGTEARNLGGAVGAYGLLGLGTAAATSARTGATTSTSGNSAYVSAQLQELATSVSRLPGDNLAPMVRNLVAQLQATGLNASNADLLPILDAMLTQWNNRGKASYQYAREAERTIDKLQAALPSITESTAASADPLMDVLLSLSGVLPGTAGSIGVILLGAVSMFLGQGVVRSRLRDHQTSANLHR